MSRFDEQDDLLYPRPETPELNGIVAAQLSRRSFLRAAGVMGMTMFLGASAQQGFAARDRKASPLLGFQQVPSSILDEVKVPADYKADVLISWGDPLFPQAPEFLPTADAAAQELQFGDNNDGMSFFLRDEQHAVMAINNEYTNYEYLLPHHGPPQDLAEVRKAQAAHGVSIVELIKDKGQWVANRSGALNRRITAQTKMELTGPAAGHDLLKTPDDPAGRWVYGTFNNCANGQTPWGTYLTCEENFNGYFGSESDPQLMHEERYHRYGISRKNTEWMWHASDERFDLARNPQEPHRFGWVVEIDPFDPQSVPQKRTALGRFKHENAALVINPDGRVIVYLGDDEKGEHLYKFVSRGKYDPAHPAENRKLLDEGTLYVARFDGEIGKHKGHGHWIELTWGKHGLTSENGFADQATVLIFARQAATQVGATTMDRPEWVAVHPDQQHVFCTLTNNDKRGVDPKQPLNPANPRPVNLYGHIIRWAPANRDHTSEDFEWDLYLLAGNPTVEQGPSAGSGNIHSDNMFNSPDGLGFDADGRLWILTDGAMTDSGPYKGMGNNQMLCGDPTTGEVRRFLTAPIGAEVTGICFAPDHRTMFVGIQHPGERQPPSHWPQGGSSTPRSSVLRITRTDGGVIGT